jgi:hypothetical protein
VASGQKYHLRVLFSDNAIYDSTRLGDPDVTIIFRSRRAEWAMVLGEHGLRKLVNIGYRKTFGRFEHPLTLVKRLFLEWRQNNKDFAQAKRNAAFHYGLPTEFFHIVLGDTFGLQRALLESRHAQPRRGPAQQLRHA